ncbi:MAG: hypothetical protein GC154_05855 [bacterium]|nr:hypothetical protein [bacterium]
MQRRRLYEALAVLAVLALILTLTLPAFLDNQYKDKLARVFHDMNSIVSAIHQYQVDNGRLPDQFNSGGRMERDGESFRFISLNWDYMHVWLKPFFPEQQNIPREIAQLREAYGSLYLVVQFDEPGSTRAETIGMLTQWPMAKRLMGPDVIDAGFIQRFHLNLNLKLDTPLFESTLFFNPTNGLDSSGFLYLDDRGRHSPSAGVFP